MAGTSRAEIAVEKAQKEDIGRFPGKEEYLYRKNASARSACSCFPRAGREGSAARCRYAGEAIREGEGFLSLVAGNWGETP